MDTKWKNSKGIRSAGVLLAVLGITVLFMACFPVFERRAEQYFEDPFTGTDFISRLCGANYIQYKYLRDRVDQTDWSYPDLYVKDTPLGTFGEGEWQGSVQNGSVISVQENVVEGSDSLALLLRQYKQETLEELPALLSGIQDLTQRMDYYALDTRTGVSIGNSEQEALQQIAEGTEDPNAVPYVYYICFCYDSAGNLESSRVRAPGSGDGQDFLKRVEAVSRQLFFKEGGYDESGRQTVMFLNSEKNQRYCYELTQIGPASVRIVYAMTQSQYEALQTQIQSLFEGPSYRGIAWESYQKAGVGHIFQGFFVLSVLLGSAAAWYFRKKTPGQSSYRLGIMEKLPLELHLFSCFLVLFARNFVCLQICNYQKGWFLPNLSGNILEPLGLEEMRLLLLGLMLYLFFLLAFLEGQFFFGLCRSVNAIKQHSLICRYWNRICRFAQSFYRDMLSYDIGTDARKWIRKLVLLNFAALLLLLGLFGRANLFFSLFLYSVILYAVLKKYIIGVQKKYRALLDATSAIAQGDFDIALSGDFGIFESYHAQLEQIQRDFRRAVEQEVKSQRMKSELITNVSHDLKTPLTAIITYINLLKEPSVTEEQRREYLNILDRKAVRLKVLIEDLFEVSQASTQNITLNWADVDIGNLMRQCYLENEDRFVQADLAVKMLLPQEKVILRLDPQKTYRIFENLYTNIIKYALPSTRVYIMLKEYGEDVAIELKNISRVELQIEPEELMERFVRGDSARNTEGSGLGLAIAQSFTELQHGTLHITLDGDLFKVTLLFHRPEKQKEESAPED